MGTEMMRFHPLSPACPSPPFFGAPSFVPRQQEKTTSASHLSPFPAGKKADLVAEAAPHIRRLSKRGLMPYCLCMAIPSKRSRAYDPFIARLFTLTFWKIVASRFAQHCALLAMVPGNFSAKSISGGLGQRPAF